VNWSIVIPSARADNLVPCVQAILRHEPRLDTRRIFVVDDGARAQAESQLPPLSWVQGIKPFIYARNANLGLQASASDAILLNDDAMLTTPFGFTQLVEEARSRPSVAICSAGVLGAICNRRQLATSLREFRIEPNMLAFVCVFIPASVRDSLGPLDERYDGYGFDDDDYCARALKSGMELGVWDGCIVDHSGLVPSTFRSQPAIHSMMDHNRRLFHAKWGESR